MAASASHQPAKRQTKSDAVDAWTDRHRYRACARSAGERTDRQTRHSREKLRCFSSRVINCFACLMANIQCCLGEITLSQAGRGRVGWYGMGWDGWCGAALCCCARFEQKIHSTWPTWRDVDWYVPKRSIQVHAHRYVSICGTLYRIRYVPAAAIAVTESENVPMARP